MSFWNKFEALCFEHNLKPQSSEIMDACGVTSPAITAWKKGSKPKYEVIARLAKFFNVDERYLLDLSDSPHGEDIIEDMTDKMIENGADIAPFDDDTGSGKFYAVLYEGHSHTYQEQEYKTLCIKLRTLLNDAELFTVKKFCHEEFKKDSFDKNINNLTREETELLDRYRQLSKDGKIKVMSALIDEERHQNHE